MGSSSRFARFVLVLSCLSILAGCASAPEPYEAKTRVYRDGFFARQVTYVPAGWNSRGREYETFCLWSQLVQSPVDGGWYCPGDGSMDMLKTKISLAQTTHTPTYRENVIPALGDAANGLAIGIPVMVGLKGIQPARMTQSVTGNLPINTSTLLINGPVPPGVAR